MTHPLGPSDVKRWLQANRLDAIWHEDLPRVHTVAEAAEVLGVPQAAIVKTVIFDHAGTPLAVLTPGDAKVRDRLVAVHLGASRNALRMARPGEVLEWTGYPVGGVPPVAHRQQIRILVDTRLLGLERAVFGGGSDAALVVVDPRALQAVIGAEPGVFCG